MRPFRSVLFLFALAGVQVVGLVGCQPSARAPQVGPQATATDPTSATSVSSPSTATVEVVLVPRKQFFGNPQRARARISPDGSQLAFLAPLDDVLNVWVAPVADPSDA